jgi:thymidylate synthase (FAD)
MPKYINNVADNLLDKEFQVLDHGFVKLIEYMGNDTRVADMARISYSSKQKKNSDEKLINRLMKDTHTSPFEQVTLAFHLKLPIFVMRQLGRYRTARYIEKSGRYSTMDDIYVPKLERFVKESQKYKSNSSELLDDSELWKERFKLEKNLNLDFYNKGLTSDLVKEVARMPLPLSTYTEAYWQIDLHNMFNLLRQRLDHHAQWEIREYAQIFAEIVKHCFPICYSAFEEYVLEAKKISKTDLAKILKLVQNSQIEEEIKKIYQVQ